jgi:hypothetical protein
MGYKEAALKKKESTTIKPKKEISYIVCAGSCSPNGTPKKETEFYLQNNEVTPRYPICKDCLKKVIDPMNIQTVYNVLRNMNKPFIKSLWDSLYATADLAENVFGTYMSKISSMAQFKKLTWDNSEFKTQQEVANEKATEREEALANKALSGPIKMFGPGFSEDEYVSMGKKYTEMSAEVKSSVFHKEALVSYIKYRQLADRAIAENNLDGIKAYSDLAQKEADKAGITPKQLNKEVIDEELGSVSELSKAIEQVDDVISLLPKFYQRPHDLPDYVIYCIIDNLRAQLDMPPIEYKEVYKFYDKKKEEFIKKNSWAKDLFYMDNTSMRKVAEDFINIPEEV